MKKVLLHIVLFAYAFMLLRSALPFVMDMFAHAFWYSQHIATVHVKNGKYHVHYQSINEAQKNVPAKTTHTIKTENYTTDHIFSGDRFDLMLYPVRKKKFPQLASQISEIFLQLNLPPPKI
ncbi:MAG TPA: hypothetical protein VKT28_15740 [Puia sp.]|nr:hypothetical protein [Puia sp.]